MIFIDGGATHNFIESVLVKRFGLPMIDIGYFRVLVVGRQSLACTLMVQHLYLSMYNHTVTYYFFVMDL
jgi:hypothetical protein